MEPCRTAQKPGISAIPDGPPWDLRAAICKAGAAEIRGLADDALMFLLLEAVYPQDIDDLFAELYRRYYERVHSWCRRLMKDRDRADDVTQEVFMRAFRYRHSFRGDARTSTWLYTVTRNYCLTALSKANGEPVADAALLDTRLRGSTGLEIHQRLERDEAFLEIWRLIHTALTPVEARVMVLHYGHGLPLALISRQLQLSNPSGAKAYIVNAKRKLTALLANSGNRRRQPAREVNRGLAAA